MPPYRRFSENSQFFSTSDMVRLQLFLQRKDRPRHLQVIFNKLSASKERFLARFFYSSRRKLQQSCLNFTMDTESFSNQKMKIDESIDSDDNIDYVDSIDSRSRGGAGK
jgi:hypothetical protein